MIRTRRHAHCWVVEPSSGARSWRRLRATERLKIMPVKGLYRLRTVAARCSSNTLEGGQATLRRMLVAPFFAHRETPVMVADGRADLS